jgi:DNA-binding transcriptional LysR family regulator
MAAQDRKETLRAQKRAAAEGVGVAYLLDHVCTSRIASGRLVHVIQDWHSQVGLIHIVFTTRRGLPQPVSALIDHLAGVLFKPMTAGALPCQSAFVVMRTIAG